MRVEFLLILSILLMYFNHLQGWIAKWFDFNSFYSIGLLVFVFIFYFFKDQWVELKKIPHQPRIIGYPLILTALLLYYVGTKADINYFSSLSLPLLLAGVTLALYGREMFIKILPVLLFFTVSLPIFPIFRITMPLQLMLASIIAKFFSLIGMDASHSGSLIILEGRYIDVEAGCSGVTSLYSLFVAVFMYIYYKSIKLVNKTYLVLSAIILSLMGNFVRIAVTSLYILYNGGQGSYEKFHENLGIIIFVVLIGIVFTAANVLEVPENAEE